MKMADPSEKNGQLVALDGREEKCQDSDRQDGIGQEWPLDMEAEEMLAKMKDGRRQWKELMEALRWCYRCLLISALLASRLGCRKGQWKDVILLYTFLK
ncbi:hypothetical protein CBR_g2875 [Chara braunii]|uniref:Uncharacterized protein n=1 Tax=Chara braunii TaxID=69332 RepID=A0A388KE68_CHABU|nr:hypothetical protein CBR_g2875 [Chara braunii]|eukprot:GBG68331.1 hypothetical protein CBR_g2875 [Chara braunii]